jgi:hypothetical protein
LSLSKSAYNTTFGLIQEERERLDLIRSYGRRSKTFHFNQSQVMDIFGMPVICDGGWNSPSNVEQLLTMVGNTHSARGQRGGYETSCEDCWNLERDGIHSHGCRVHRQGLRLWSQGNPCRSTIIELVTAKNNLHAATYTAHGDIAFTPDEFLDKRRKYITSLTDVM